MLRRDATGVLPLLVVLLLALFLLPELLESHDVLTLLLIDQVVHLLLNARLHIPLVELLGIYHHRRYIKMLLRAVVWVSKSFLLLFLIDFLDVVKNHKAEGESIKDI